MKKYAYQHKMRMFNNKMTYIQPFFNQRIVRFIFLNIFANC